MKESKRGLLTGFVAVLGLLIANSIAFAQTKEIEMSVDDPRPMAAAVRKIVEFYGIPINYEVVPVYYSGDLRDLTNLPRGWQLSFSISVEASTGKLSDLRAVKDALSKLISAYNSSGLPGGYDFEEYNGVFFVKPVRYRDATGVTQAMKPLLSTPITLPEEKRYAGPTLGLILQQVSKAAGSQIGGGLMRPNDYLLNEVTVGANNEPADHVIARLLAARACPNSAREGCGPVIAQTTWDVGYYYGLDYAPRYGYVLGINRLPDSRWIVSPPPAQPRPRPTPNPNGDAPGRIKTR